jgi:hypothetical protein
MPASVDIFDNTVTQKKIFLCGCGRPIIDFVPVHTVVPVKAYMIVVVGDGAVGNVTSVNTFGTGSLG